MTNKEQKTKDLSGHKLGSYAGVKLVGIDREKALSNFLEFAGAKQLHPSIVVKWLESEFDFKISNHEDRKIQLEIINNENEQS